MRLLTLIMFGIASVLSVSGQEDKKGKEGGTIFNEQCAGCHGQDGRAQTETGRKLNAADLTGTAVQAASDGELTKIVKNGKDKMPSFDGKLSDDEIKAVVKYIKTLGTNK